MTIQTEIAATQAKLTDLNAQLVALPPEMQGKTDEQIVALGAEIGKYLGQVLLDANL